MDVDRRWSAGFVLLLALLCGCQAGPNPSIELLESELRWMEDRLYALDRKLDQAHFQLASCRRNNAALRQQLAAPEASPGQSSEGPSPEPALPATPQQTERRATPSSRRRQDGTPENGPDHWDQTPAVDVPDIDQLDDRLQVPEIDLGPGVEPEWGPKPDLPQSDGAPNEAHRNQPATASPKVAKIQLNPRLTGGYNFDGHPGDDGIMVVIQPLDDAGRVVSEPGRLTISVMDHAPPDSAVEVARWQFTPAESLALFRNNLLGAGITLKLPWPNQPPESTHLRVNVSYQPIDTAPLLASRPIRVKAR